MQNDKNSSTQDRKKNMNCYSRNHIKLYQQAF